MRRLLLLCVPLVILPQAILAQCPSGLTLVQDTINGPIAPNGTPTLFSGTVTIKPVPAPLSLNGETFGQIPLILQVSRGTVSVCLAPNDTAIPANTFYQVRYAYTSTNPLQGSALPWTENWAVPTTSSTLTISQVRLLAMLATPGIPTPPYSGTWCLQSINGAIAFAWAVCAGGGGGALSWSTLTSGQWSTLTSSQWSSLTS